MIHPRTGALISVLLIIVQLAALHRYGITLGSLILTWVIVLVLFIIGLATRCDS